MAEFFRPVTMQVVFKKGAELLNSTESPFRFCAGKNISLQHGGRSFFSDARLRILFEFHAKEGRNATEDRDS